MDAVLKVSRLLATCPALVRLTVGGHDEGERKVSGKADDPQVQQTILSILRGNGSTDEG